MNRETRIPMGTVYRANAGGSGYAQDSASSQPSFPRSHLNRAKAGGSSYALSYALWGAIGFAIGGATAPVLVLLQPFIGFGIGGAVGGAFLAGPTQSPSLRQQLRAKEESRINTWRCALGFGTGYCFSAFPVMLPVIVLLDARYSPYGGWLVFTLFWGFGFALAGGIGALVVGPGPKLAKAGITSFGLGGLIGGGLFGDSLFLLQDHVLLCLLLALMLASSLGGGLFGAALDSLGSAEAVGDARTAMTPSHSGVAFVLRAATVFLGIVSILLLAVPLLRPSVDQRPHQYRAAEAAEAAHTAARLQLQRARAARPRGHVQTDKRVPLLILPEEGALLDNSRRDGRKDAVWKFQWSDIAGATRYHLYIISADGKITFLSQSDLTDATYRLHLSGWIGGGHELGWRWKVRAEVNGEWGPWSEEGTFDVDVPDTRPMR